MGPQDVAQVVVGRLRPRSDMNVCASNKQPRRTRTSRPTACEQDEKVASAGTGPYLTTLSGKCPRCHLKSCRASSLWPGHEGSGGAEKILTAPPPAESSCWAALCSPPPAAPSKFSRRHQRLCMRTKTMMLDNSSTVTEGTCQAGFRDMEGSIFEKLLRRRQTSPVRTQSVETFGFLVLQ